MVERPQGRKDAFLTPDYVSTRRMAEYAFQYRAVLSCGPETVLEVGPGPGVLTYLMRRTGIRVTTFDCDPSLETDVTGDVRELAVDGQFDVLTCFEVLEHVPFSDVGTALRRMGRLARKEVLISVPDAATVYVLETSLPVVGTHRFVWKRPCLRHGAHEYDGEHHWELSTRGCTEAEFLRVASDAGLRLLERARVKEHPTHVFFRFAPEDGESSASEEHSDG